MRKNKIHLHIKILFFSIFFLLFQQIQYAEKIKRKPLVISTADNVYPFHFLGETGEPEGIFIDLWKLWSKKNNTPIEFRVNIWNDSLNLMRKGEADIHAGCFYSSDREKYMDYVLPLKDIETHIFYHNSLRKLDSIAALSPYKVGVFKGDYSEAFLKNNLEYPNNIQGYNSADSLMKDLINGNILCFVMDTPTALYFLNKYDLSAKFSYAQNNALYSNSFFATVKKGDSELAKKISKGMEKITKEERKEIERKWAFEQKKHSDNSLVISYPNDYAPFSFLDNFNHERGLFIDFWNLWAKKTGQEIRFLPTYWKDSINAVKDGRADIQTGLFFSQTRSEVLDFSDPFYQIESSFFLKNDSKIADVNQMKTEKIGVWMGSFQAEYIKEQYPNIESIEFKKVISMLEASTNNLTKGFFYETLPTRRLLSTNFQENNFYKLSTFSLKNNVQAGVLKGNTELIKLINEGISKISKQEWNEIENRWISNSQDKIYGKNFTSLTEAEKEWIQTHGIIKIGSQIDYMPFEKLNNQNVTEGISFDYLNRAISDLNLDYSLEYYNQNLLKKKLAKKELDIILTVSPSKDDNQNMVFSTPYLFSDSVVLTNNQQFQSLSDLNHKKLAIEKDSFLKNYIELNYPKISIVEVDNYLEGVNLVSKESVFGFIGNIYLIDTLKNNEVINHLNIINSSTFPKIPISFGIRSDFTILKGLINKKLDSIPLNERKALFDKFLKNDLNSIFSSIIPKDLKWFNENLEIDIAVLKNNPPFSFFEDKKFKGIVIDYLELLEEQLNIKFNFIAVDNYYNFNDTNIKFISEIPEYEDFNKNFIPILNYYTEDLSIVSHDDYPIIPNLKALKDRSLIIPKKYNLEKSISLEYPDIKIISMENIEDGLNLINEKKADTILINPATLNYLVKKNGLSNLRLNSNSNFPTRLSFAIKNDSTIPLETFRVALETIKVSNGDKISKKWLGTNVNIKPSWTYIFKSISLVLLIFIIILCIILIWNNRLKREIKNRKRIEENLLKISQAIEQSPSAVVITDNNFKIEYSNEAFFKLSGYQLLDIVHEKPYFFENYDKIQSSLKAGIVWSEEKQIRTKNNRNLWTKITVSPIFSKDILSHYVVNIDDIDQQKYIEETRKHQSELEKLFADISTHLVIHSMQEIDAEIEYGLRKIGEFSKVDRGYLFLISPDRRIIYNTHEWRAEGVKSQLDILKGLFPFPWFMDQLKTFKNIYIPNVEELEEDSGIVREILMQENIKSLLFVPIRYSHDLLGFVGFDSFTKEKIWTKEDIAVLKIFGDIFANAIARKNIENKLKEAKQRADLANKAKSDFLANMSHEIRTPMNAILGITHLLSQSMLNEKQNDYVNKINQSANNLLNIINDILDFSKIEAGKIEFESIEFNLNKVLENLANIISIKAQKKNLEIIIRKSPDVPEYLIGDSLRLGQILLNLAGNSVKFTDDGEVMISVEIVEEVSNQIKLAFIVKDSGIGIEKKKLNTLFKSFIQADTSTTRKYGGTGLGLSISKKLIEMMNGDIEVKSKYGEGSTFYFTAVFEKSNRIPTNYVLPSIDLRNSNILVIDNNLHAAETLKLYCEAFGLKVDLAINPLTATKLIKKNEYQIIIVDSMCSKNTREKFITSLKEKLPLDNDAKFILAEKYSQDSFIDLKNSKFDDIIVKPITQSSIFNSIINVLEIYSPDFKKSQEEKLHESIEFIKGAKVLLVEDNEINQQVAIEILQKKGFWIDVANNGQKAIDKLVGFNDKKYDIILMDLQMPILDGYEATKIIRNELKIKDIPIIAMTADALKGVEKQCIDVGMNDYISKPIIPDILFKKLKKWINSESKYITSNNESISVLDYNKHLNIEEGIRRLGDKRVYLSLLDKFYHNNLGLTSKINKLFHEKNQEELKLIIHTLKGVSGNISANLLHKLCIDAEEKILNDLTNSEEKLISINSELNVVLESIKLKLLENAKSSDKLTEYSKEKLELLFKRLLKLLNDDDIDALDLFDEILNMSKSQVFNAELNTMKSIIQNYEFEQAISELNLFFNKHKFLKGE